MFLRREEHLQTYNLIMPPKKTKIAPRKGKKRQVEVVEVDELTEDPLEIQQLEPNEPGLEVSQDETGSLEIEGEEEENEDGGGGQRKVSETKKDKGKLFE